MVSDSAKEWMSSEGKMVAIKWRGWRGKGWRGVRKALHFCGENCTNEYKKKVWSVLDLINSRTVAMDNLE